MIAISIHPYLTAQTLVRTPRTPLDARSPPGPSSAVFVNTPIKVYTFEHAAARTAPAEFVYAALLFFCCPTFLFLLFYS